MYGTLDLASELSCSARNYAQKKDARCALALCAALLLSSCCVLMLLSSCSPVGRGQPASSQPASQHVHSASQPASSWLAAAQVQFSSVQSSYRLSVIGYRLSQLLGPHAVVRMPFELDPCF